MALTKLTTKIRALVVDIGATDYQTYEYTTSSVFTVAVSNATVTSVLQNGATLGSGEWAYNSVSQEVTITASLTSGDAIQINFSYYSYSATELKEYIRAALVYMDAFGYVADEDYEMETDDIYPVPSNRDSDVIALVASILIKPNYNMYTTPTITVRYPRTMDKDEKIKRIIEKGRWPIGLIRVITFD